MAYEILKNKNVLIVDDDRSTLEYLKLNLENTGCNVFIASNVQDAEKLIDINEIPFDISILDMYIPETPAMVLDRIMRGEELAYKIRKRNPITKIIGISINLEREPFTPISDLFSGFIYKQDIPFDKPPIILLETIEGILSTNNSKLPNIFIVHGHDDSSVYELKDYIRSTLNLGVPTILRDKPSSGKTIIEKFERESKDINLVFVLMTPDDNMNSDIKNDIRRTRQNVIFELGFFYAKLQRTSGRIIILTKGELEIPSDISGVIYIDITNGIKAGGELIRLELIQLGWIK